MTTVYLNGQYINKSEVAISPDDRGFLFGDGAYEVIRSYPACGLFQAEPHLKRLERSICELKIEYPSAMALMDVAQRLIEENGLTGRDAAVYLQVTRGAAVRKHAFPKEGTPATVYASASPFRINTTQQENGTDVVLVPDIRWSRCDIKSLNLIPNVLSNQHAKDTDCGESLFVRDNMVTEGTHTNVCAVFDGRVHTYPACNYILSGITREVVLDLCATLSIPAELHPVSAERFITADEVFLTGSTTEITPVVVVDGRKIGDGRPGPVTRKLQGAYRDLIL